MIWFKQLIGKIMLLGPTYIKKRFITMINFIVIIIIIIIVIIIMSVLYIPMFDTIILS